MSDAQGLLSVDVDAQLRKLPGRRNLSRHHYPVELIRGALARGAGTVNVSISRKWVEVMDDGAPPAPSVLAALAGAYDAARSDVERTAALEVFEDGVGLELLGAFSPTPSSVEVACAAERGSRQMLFRNGRLAADGMVHHERVGTRIRICRSGNPGREREAVLEHCRFASGRVLLDGRQVAPGQPPGALAATRVAAALEHGPGVLWIPLAGDVCRVRLLRNGVVFRQAALPARLGFLFHVALEADELPSGAALENLRLVAEEQYGLLSRRYPSLDPGQQDRTDELMFLLHRRGGESALVASHAPFRIRGRDDRLSLGAVRALEREGPLVAVRAGSLQDWHVGGDGAGKALALTARQREFLVTDLGYRIMDPPRPEGGLWAGVQRFWVRAGDLASGRLFSRFDAVPDDLLDPGERAFLAALSGHVVPQLAELVVFVRGGGRRCWVEEMAAGRRRLGILRSHRLVKSAVSAFARDPENLRIFVALLDEAREQAPTRKGDGAR